MEQLKKEYADTNAWGIVSSVNVYQCNPEFIKDPIKIEAFIVALCKEIDMKRFGAPHIQRFADGALEGYSAMQFIETSSITMHFDETENRAFIDIFSCKFFDHTQAEAFCRTFFEGNRSTSNYYLRY